MVSRSSVSPVQRLGSLVSGVTEAGVRLAEGAAGAAGSLAPALGTLPALLLATLATLLPALAGYYALRSFLRLVRHPLGRACVPPGLRQCNSPVQLQQVMGTLLITYRAVPHRPVNALSSLVGCN